MAITKVSRGLLSTGISDSSDATAITIDSSERVGIGTTNPPSKLTVSGSDGGKGIELQVSTGSVQYLMAYDRSASDYIDMQIDAENLRFGTNTGAERMRINSSGNLGIGTTNPDALLHLQSAGAASAHINLESTHSGGIPIYNMKGAHSSQVRYQDENGNNQTRIDFHDAGEMHFIDAANSATRMKIFANGAVTVGSTTASSMKLNVDAGGAHGVFVDDIGTGYDGIQVRGSNTTGSFFAMSFKRSNNTLVGYILAESSSTSYVSGSSDLSVKENIEDWNESVLDKFKDIKPVTFNFISDESKETKKGYIAQNEVDKFPEAYPKNPNDGKYSFNPSGMVTYLMKAIQEQQEQIDALQSEINILKGGE